MHNTQPMALSTSTLALAARAPAVVAPAPAISSAADMMTLRATCAFFGGDRPLNPSTLYRGIKAGRYPKPVHVGPNSSRWVRSECDAARKKLIDGDREVREHVAAKVRGRDCAGM